MPYVTLLGSAADVVCIVSATLVLQAMPAML